jgi:hypothetical protein
MNCKAAWRTGRAIKSTISEIYYYMGATPFSKARALRRWNVK